MCLVLSLLVIAASLPLGCLPIALSIGGFSLLDGIVLGVGLALVTRVRSPWIIYFLLGLCALTVWPLIDEWPPGGALDVHLWPGVPSLAYGYLDAVRLMLFLLGVPAPFALLGHHGPDSVPTSDTIEGSTPEA